ncbi:hypothetical protein C8R43DRAFT_1123247 [Mycena crocata]|nr:hypothetical protein C8R43DRAFT_1123247 [Mycena crocata]
MPSRTTRYVQPAGSPLYYAGASTSTSPYPSPTYTMSSLSPGTMTPPHFNHSRSLYACAPLPALNGETGHIHPVLSGAHGRHALTFDLSYDPTYTVSSSPVLTPRVLAESATTPALPCVTIVSDLFPWRIAIYPSSSKPGACCTVADVLNGIYRELRQQVPKDELAAVPRAHRTSVSQAYSTRMLTRPEADRAIRRIDFLLGNHRFCGLQPTSENPDVWRLTVSS